MAGPVDADVVVVADVAGAALDASACSPLVAELAATSTNAHLAASVAGRMILLHTSPSDMSAVMVCSARKRRMKAVLTPTRATEEDEEDEGDEEDMVDVCVCMLCCVCAVCVCVCCVLCVVCVVLCVGRRFLSVAMLAKTRHASSSSSSFLASQAHLLPATMLACHWMQAGNCY